MILHLPSKCCRENQNGRSQFDKPKNVFYFDHLEVSMFGSSQSQGDIRINLIQLEDTRCSHLHKF